MAYGDRLRELRAERQLSLRQVEELGGPNKDTMSLIERGEHKPRAQTLGRIAKAFNMSVAELRADLEAAENPLGAAPPSQPRLFNGTLEEERRLRYLRALRLFATAMNKQWTDRVERGNFTEEDFERAIYVLRDFEAAYVMGIGTDLLAALRTQQLTLPEAEREAFDGAKDSIDAWHLTMWRAYDMLRARGNVARLDDYRKPLEAYGRAAGE